MTEVYKYDNVNLSELKFFNKITKVITIVLINIPDPNL